MIPILFNKDEKTFTSLGLGQMDATLVEVERERNGNYTLYAEVPFNSPQAKHLTKEMLIKADAGSRTKWQTFKINRTIKDTNADVIKVYADHISMDTINDAMKPKVVIRQQTAEGALRQWANNLVSGKAYDVQSDITHVGSTEWTIDEVENARQALGGVSGSILDVWGGEYEFDNNTIILHKEMGRTAPTVLEYGRNIVSLEYEELIDGVYTSIYPYATYTPKSEDNKQLPDIMVTLDELIIDSEYAGNYETRRIQIVDFSSEFDSNAENPEIPTQDKLRTLAKAYVKNNGYGIPRISQEIDFVDLSKTLDYQDIQVMEEIELNDRVPVYYPNIDAETNDVKVTTTNWDVLNNRYSKITLSTIGAMNTNSITSKLSTAIKDLKAEQKKLNNTVPYLLNGQGNRVWYTTPDENMEHKIGDTWFKKNGKYTIIYKWNGSMWEEVLNDETFITEIEAEVAKAQEEAEKASQSAKDADARAGTAIEKAGANANLLTTHQNTLDTIKNTTIPNINSAISDAMAEARKADGKIETFKTDIGKTISDVNVKAQKAIDDVGLVDGKVETFKTDVGKTISTVSDSAKLAMDEAKKADGKIADYVTRNGLVSGTTVDTKINDATGEWSQNLSRVEGKIPTSVGGRNYLLNSGKPTALTINSNNNNVYPITKGVEDGVDWFYQSYVDGTESFLVSTYIAEYYPSKSLYGSKFSKDFEGYGGIATYSVDVMSEQPITMRIGLGSAYGVGKNVTLIPNQWTRISVSVDVTKDNRPMAFMADVRDNIEIPYKTKIYWKNYKIEKGNIATDYSLAPEDNYTQQDFKIFEASYNSSVEGIDAKLGTVSNKVDDNGKAFTEFKDNEYKRTAERVSDTFTKQETTTMLGGKADASQLSNYLAKSTYERDAEQSKERFETIESDLDNISVGGRNLFRNSNFANELNWWQWNGQVSRVKVDGNDAILLTGTNNGFFQTPTQVEDGGIYTISFKAKSVGDSSQVRFGFLNQPTGNVAVKSIDNTWKTYSFTTTGGIDINLNTYTHFYAFRDTAEGVYITDLKIEKGTIATDWSPAVEDMANISYVSSEITKSANAITTSLSNYARTTDLNGLATETYASNIAVSEAGKVKNELTKYAKTTDLTGLASETYATNVAVNEATKVSNELTKYAKSTDLTGLATETYAQTQATTEAGKVEQKLTGYAKTTDLNGLATETYATNKAVSEAGKVKNELTKYELKTGVDSKISTASSALRTETAEKMKTVYTKTETETLLGKKADSSTLNNYVQQATYNEGIDGVSQSLVRVEGKIDGLQVGGRNLIKRSDFGNIVLSGVSSVVVLDEDYQNGLKATGGNNGRVNYIEFPNVLDGNGWYTVSFLARGTQNGTRGLSVVIGGSPALTDGRISNTSNEYTYHTYSYKVENYNSETNNSIKIAELDYAYYRIDNIKLEKGNKATDWTPAPEDTLTQDEYKAFKSDYESTVEGITGQITSLSTSKLDGNTYTNFLSNEYKSTAERATSAFTKVNKIIDANGNSTDTFAKAVYDRNATRQSADFQTVTKDLVQTATYTAGINGVTESIQSIRGDINNLGARNYFIRKEENVNKIYGWATGILSGENGSIASDLIGVKEGDTFSSNTSVSQVAFYDSNKTYLGSLQGNGGALSKTSGGSYTNFIVPSGKNIYFMRVTFRNNIMSGIKLDELKVMLNKGNVSLDWSPAPEEMLGQADFQIFKGVYEKNDEAIKQRLTAIDSSAEGSVVTRLNKTESTASGNSQLIATINSNYVKQSNIDASILADKKIKDTRSTTQLPSWYFSNYPAQEVREFKQVSTMGIGSGSYGILTTNVPWTGSSGGTVKQKFETNTETYVRQSNTGATAWGSWSKQVDTSDTTYQKVTQTSSLYERILGSTNEADVKSNISRIVQTSNVIQQTVTSAMNVENRNLLITKNAIKDSWLTGNEGYPKPSLQTDSGTSTSPDLIEVKDGDKFTLSKNEITLYFRVSFLNSSKVYIGRYVQNAKLGTITPPSGTAYMWVSYPTNADAKVEKGSIATGYSPAPEDTATQSQITQLADNINLKVSNSDLLSQINVQAGGVLIQSGTNKLNVTPTTTYIQNGTIESAMIKSLDAGKITAGTLDASKVTVTNLDANSITANQASLVQAGFKSSSGGSLNLSGDQLLSTASDGSQVYLQNGVVGARTPSGATIGQIGYAYESSSPWYSMQVSHGSHFQIRMSRGAGELNKQAFYIVSGGTESYLNTDNIYFNPSSSGRVRVQGSMNVDGTLRTEGTALVRSRIEFLNGGSIESQSANSNMVIGASNKMIIYTNGTNALEFDANNAVFRRKISENSDIRLKTNIIDMPIDSLDAIRNMEIKKFDYLDGRTNYYGIIAQQAQQYLPELINTDSEGYLMVDKSAMTYVNMHAIQQLDSKVDDELAKTNDEVTQLKAKIATLEKELATLKGA